MISPVSCVSQYREAAAADLHLRCRHSVGVIAVVNVVVIVVLSLVTLP